MAGYARRSSSMFRDSIARAYASITAPTSAAAFAATVWLAAGFGAAPPLLGRTSTTDTEVGAGIGAAAGGGLATGGGEPAVVVGPAGADAVGAVAFGRPALEGGVWFGDTRSCGRVDGGTLAAFDSGFGMFFGELFARSVEDSAGRFDAGWFADAGDRGDCGCCSLVAGGGVIEVVVGEVPCVPPAGTADGAAPFGADDEAPVPRRARAHPASTSTAASATPPLEKTTRRLRVRCISRDLRPSIADSIVARNDSVPGKAALASIAARIAMRSLAMSRAEA